MVRRHVWMSAAVLLMLSGCAGRSSCSVAPGFEPELLPAVGRGDFSAEMQAPSANALPSSDTTAAPSAYRQLLALQCQCLAVDASAKANILDLEGQAATQKAEAKKFGHGKPSLMADVLNFLAMEERNKDAASALDFYYRLGEAEASADILRETLLQVGDALNKARELKGKGLEVKVDETALHRQKLDLESQAVKLQLQIEQFSGELRRRLALAPCEVDWRFWPAQAFHIAIGCVETPQAIAVGLENRPILLLLNLLETELAEGDPATVRRMLGMVNNALGQGGSCPCLKKLLAILCGTAEERALRRQQLALYRTDREREVVEDIRHAVLAIQTQKEALLLALQKAESWHDKVKEAEEKQSKGLGSFADTTDARVNWLKARRAIAEEFINMQRAWVQLRQAQGILPLECSSAPANPASSSPPADPEIEVLPRPRTIIER
ncbi:MAG: TolC family protein [Planctomycetes bacterium]|nr:TolC family protein [Planctomycetota bacterium]